MTRNRLSGYGMAVLLAVGCVSGGVVTGCGSDNPSAPIVAAPGVVTISDADNGRSVLVANGGTVTATLASNASTGYQWKVTSTDTQRLPQVGSSVYIAPPAGSPPGAGGFQVFTFRAQATGTVPLSLEYDPPGGGTPGGGTPGGGTPAKTYAVSMVVQ